MRSFVADNSMSRTQKPQFLSPTATRLCVQRNGHNIVRSAGVPKPIVLVDAREQTPFPLLLNHRNWIADERRVVLRTGDYSVQGMENLLTLERKSLADMVNCTNIGRPRFIAGCARMAKFRWKAILIEASYEDIKRGWEDSEIYSDVHPNSVSGLLDAVEAKFGIPVLLTSRNRDLATERAASWLSKHFTYWWLEQSGYDRVLIDADCL